MTHLKLFSFHFTSVFDAASIFGCFRNELISLCCRIYKQDAKLCWFPDYRCIFSKPGPKTLVIGVLEESGFDMVDFSPQVSGII